MYSLSFCIRVVPLSFWCSRLTAEFFSKVISDCLAI
nr:MAG TPA: hypothetical protein [Caudoviricetes sp.]